MKLIVGLGNPGAQYMDSRHNTGFVAVERLASTWGASWHEKTRFKSWVAEVMVGEQKTLLAKPTTFYNLSGEAVRAIADFYQLSSSDILVTHDELDLPFGTIRTRIGGRDAGNNGIKSLVAHVGIDFARIRVGVANDQLSTIGAHDFVLSRFTQDEQTLLPQIWEKIQTFADDFIRDDRTFVHDSATVANHP